MDACIGLHTYRSIDVSDETLKWCTSPPLWKNVSSIKYKKKMHTSLQKNYNYGVRFLLFFPSEVALRKF